MTAEAALELLRNGDPAGALALLGETASPDEIDPARHAARGMVLLANDLPAEALTALRTAVALGDNSPPTLLNLALAEQKAGDRRARWQLMEALERRLPEWDEPPLRIAEALRAADRFGDAELAYGRALEINPQRESALLGLGRSADHARRGRDRARPAAALLRHRARPSRGLGRLGLCADC